jgi:type IV pilus assembly protein PilM
MNLWNKNLIKFQERCFGLDLNDFSAKVFLLDRNKKKDVVRSYNMVSMNSGYMRDGRILDKDNVAKLLKELVKRAGPKKINTKKVICSIPESKVFLRTISIPLVNEYEAESAVKWETEASIPMSVDKVYYDWQFLEQENGKQKVLTVAVAKEVVDDLVGVLEQAGFEVYGLEMESIACVRSLVPAGNGAELRSFLIIDVGAEKTSLIISRGHVPYFTSSIPFSSSALTDQISVRMNVSREEAEKIKIAQGIDMNADSAIFNSARPFFENLAVEIEKTIDFYQTITPNAEKVGQIILSGGGANLKGFPEFLISRITGDVTLGDPWGNLRLNGKLPSISRENSLRFATAIGLSMGISR